MAGFYPSQGYASRDNGHQRAYPATSSPFNHSRRSWTDGGVHYTMETASYTSPGLSFSTTSGGANGLFDAFLAPQEPVQRRPVGGFGTGLLGTALNLLGAASEVRQANQAQQPQTRSRARRVQIEEPDDGDQDEEDLAYGEPQPSYGHTRRPRSMFSRFKEKLSDNSRGAKKASHGRDGPEEQRPRASRHSSFRTEAREPQWTQTYAESNDSDSTQYEAPRPHYEDLKPTHTGPRQAESTVALENAVAYHQAQIEKCRRRLERASRQSAIDSTRLQTLLNELKMHELSLVTATENLHAEQNRMRGAGSRRSAPDPVRSQPSRQRSATVEDEYDEIFSSPGFATFNGQPRAARPLFADFGDLHTNHFARSPFAAFHNHFFTPLSGPSVLDDDFHTFFAMPSGYSAGAQRKRPRFTTANSGSRSQPAPGFATFAPSAAAKPPSTLMKPDEAKQLYKLYNERWTALPHNNPNIPYPTRGLSAQALQARNTLWAPHVSSHPSAWSEETVMKANAQLFFLNVVDLVPQYTEAPGTGSVQMSYERVRATPAQVQQLVDILKKERNRWHSDRLGRRNGGTAGTNETLQNDERARAVFHAVCELLESVQ